MAVWFRRKDKLSGVPPHLRGSDGSVGHQPAFYRIEYDMMKKGAIIQRRGKPIRQFAVTVNMSTRVVTSGDVVDHNTFTALVAAGAVDRSPPVAGAETEDSESPEAAAPGACSSGSIIDEE